MPRYTKANVASPGLLYPVAPIPLFGSSEPSTRSWIFFSHDYTEADATRCEVIDVRRFAQLKNSFQSRIPLRLRSETPPSRTPILNGGCSVFCTLFTAKSFSTLLDRQEGAEKTRRYANRDRKPPAAEAAEAQWSPREGKLNGPAVDE